MQHVPYRGAALAIQDLLAGQIDVVLDNITSALPQARAGAVKGLAITTAKRSSMRPSLTPIAEVVPGFDVTSWFALVRAEGTPRRSSTACSRTCARRWRSRRSRRRWRRSRPIPSGSTPEELAALLKKETESWGQLIRDAGIKAG